MNYTHEKAKFVLSECTSRSLKKMKITDFLFHVSTLSSPLECFLHDHGGLSVVCGCGVWSGMCGFLWWVRVVVGVWCVWRLCRVVCCACVLRV